MRVADTKHGFESRWGHQRRWTLAPSSSPEKPWRSIKSGDPQVGARKTPVAAVGRGYKSGARNHECYTMPDTFWVDLTP